MSYKLYAFRVSKEKLPELVKILKEQFPQKPHYTLTNTESAVWFMGDSAIKLQLFDFESDWIFRVLSSGYAVENYLWNSKIAEVSQVNYDTRVEMLPEDEKNLAIAERIDQLIRSQEYIIEAIRE